jgi:hypothetical protein
MAIVAATLGVDNVAAKANQGAVFVREVERHWGDT